MSGYHFLLLKYSYIYLVRYDEFFQTFDFKFLGLLKQDRRILFRLNAYEVIGPPTPPAGQKRLKKSLLSYLRFLTLCVARSSMS